MSNQLTRRDFAIRTAGFGLAGCPISRVLCEKWGFSPTPSDPQPALRQIFSSHQVARNGAPSLLGWKMKMFLDDMSNSGLPFDYRVKAEQQPAATPLQEEDLAHSQEENDAEKEN
jgi:hypothetical protein